MKLSLTKRRTWDEAEHELRIWDEAERNEKKKKKNRENDQNQVIKIIKKKRILIITVLPDEAERNEKKGTEKIKIKIKWKELYLISKEQSLKGDGETNQEGKKKKKNPNQDCGPLCVPVCRCAWGKEPERDEWESEGWGRKLSEVKRAWVETWELEVSERMRGEAEWGVSDELRWESDQIRLRVSF